MAANGKAADDGRVSDLANTVNARLEEARGFGATRRWWPGWYYGPAPLSEQPSRQNNIGTPVQLWVPLYVPHDVIIDRIALEITTGVPAGPVVTLAIYDSNALDQPKNLVLTAGTIDPTSNGIKQITISHSLTRGVWWLSMHATDQVKYRGMSGAPFPMTTPSGAPYASNPYNGFSKSGNPTLFDPAPSANLPIENSPVFTAPYITVRAAV